MRRLAAAASVLALMNGALGVSAAPFRPNKQAAPLVVSITARKALTAFRYNVQVEIDDRSRRGTGVEVRVGGFSCQIPRGRSRCSVRSMLAGSVEVSARVLTAKQPGRWGAVVPFEIQAGAVWRRGMVPSGKSFSGTTTTSPSPTKPANGTLTFDLGDAVALFLGDTPTSSGSIMPMSSASNLKKIDSRGQVWDAIKSGRATIEKFYIAPNDKLYAYGYFQVSRLKSYLYGDQPETFWCSLIEVDRTSGAPICIIEANGDVEVNTSVLDDIQFDGSGAIYFPALRPIVRGGNVHRGVESAQFVRRFKDGAATDFGDGYWKRDVTDARGNKFDAALLNDVGRYVVLADGTLILDQAHSDDSWVADPLRPSESRPTTYTLDVFLPSGEKKSITKNRFSESRERSYMLVDAGNGSVWSNWEIIDVKTASISGLYLGGEGFGDPRFTFQSLGCPSLTQKAREDWYVRENRFFLLVCFGGALAWRKSFKLLGRETFALLERCRMAGGYGTRGSSFCTERDHVADNYADSGILLQITPVPSRLATSLQVVDDALPLVDQIVMAGQIEDGRFSTVLYDPKSRTERILVAPNSDIRIRRVAFNSRTNSLWFSGTQVADGASILGEVGLEAGSTPKFSSFGEKLTGFQSFSS